MTLVTNVDGRFIAHDPADHCKHGVYVGGCGWDFMCGRCEDGSPDLTLRQAAEHVDRLARGLWSASDALRENLIGHGMPAGEAVRLVDEVMADQGELARAVRDRDWIASVCDGPEDGDYLARLHRARIAAYRSQEGE